MRDDFAVIVNSHKRPDFTAYDVLRRCNYSGKIYVIVDDEDDTVESYERRHGKRFVDVFHKENEGKFDTCDNFSEPMGVVMFSRNEAWELAKRENIKYFFVMDDDLKSINFRYVVDDKLKSKVARHLDSCFEAMCEFMETDDRIYAMGFGLGNDYIGGVDRYITEFGKKRLIMNGYLCCTERYFPFNGRICEDSVTSLNQAEKGKLFINLTSIMTVYDIWMPNKKQGNGGMQNTYKKMSSYAMRGYALMTHPSCVKIKQVENGFDTMIQKQFAYPQIVSDRWKK